MRSNLNVNKPLKRCLKKCICVEMYLGNKSNDLYFKNSIELKDKQKHARLCTEFHLRNKFTFKLSLRCSSALYLQFNILTIVFRPLSHKKYFDKKTHFVQFWFIFGICKIRSTFKKHWLNSKNVFYIFINILLLVWYRPEDVITVK